MEVPESDQRKTLQEQEIEDTESKLKILSFHVKSNIKYRYARTVVASKVANLTNTSQEATFSMVLPDTAFIAGFFMVVDGKEFNAYVKEKEEAKRTYMEAVQQGRTAGHIAQSARDSNRFIVSVNIEPHKEVTFNLTYEELLTRKLGVYKHVINLDPGQIVKDLDVEVLIQELSDIKDLEVPALKTSEEIDAKPLEGFADNLAIVERLTAQSAAIKFYPTLQKQKELSANGIKGQFIVKYDLDRKKDSQEIFIDNGYFAHYFAPEKLKPLPKHVIFALDVSGSMSGRKIQQLKEAMSTILSDLREQDYFSLITFRNLVQIWRHSSWAHSSIEDLTIAETVMQANSTNINRAKSNISFLQAAGGTDMYEALKLSTRVAKVAKNLSLGSPNNEGKPKPIIIFLTDGRPNGPVSDLDTIIADTTRWNQESKASIFSLALGYDADLDFLKRLSLRNWGFATQIYEASDTALQLRDFYRQVSSPLLSNVIFNYREDQVDYYSLTRNQFTTFFLGTELIVAGRLERSASGEEFNYDLSGRSSEGLQTFEKQKLIITTGEIADDEAGFMERLWAHLRIKQLMDEEKTCEGKEAEKKKQEATKLALKYSFVTPVTSLVVVKPEDKEKQSDTEAEKTGESEDEESSGPSSTGQAVDLQSTRTDSQLQGRSAMLKRKMCKLTQTSLERERRRNVCSSSFGSSIPETLESTYASAQAFGFVSQNSMMPQTSGLFGSPSSSGKWGMPTKTRTRCTRTPAPPPISFGSRAFNQGGTGFQSASTHSQLQQTSTLFGSSSSQSFGSPGFSFGGAPFIQGGGGNIQSAPTSFQLSQTSTSFGFSPSVQTGNSTDPVASTNPSAHGFCFGGTSVNPGGGGNIQSAPTSFQLSQTSTSFGFSPSVQTGNSTDAVASTNPSAQGFSFGGTSVNPEHLRSKNSSGTADLSTFQKFMEQSNEVFNLEEFCKTIEKTVRAFTPELQTEVKAKLIDLVSQYVFKNLQLTVFDNLEQFFETVETTLSAFSLTMQTAIAEKIYDLVSMYEKRNVEQSSSAFAFTLSATSVGK